jgi:cell division protein FtsQ
MDGGERKMRRLGEIFDKPNSKPQTAFSHEDTAAARGRRKQTASRKLFAFRTASILVPAVVFGAATGIGLWAWHSGRLDAHKYYLSENLYGISAGLGLKVQNVTTKGRKFTSVEEVASAIGLHDGEAILKFEPAAAQKRFEALPWIKTAVIKRQLPDTLSIVLEERVPVALWQKDYRHSLVDQEGVLIPGAPVSDYRHLPIVVGEGAAENAAELLATLGQQPELFGKLKSAIRISNRRWSLVLKNDVLVVLPEDSIDEAWHRLARLQKSDKILDRAITSVDLRLPDRVVLRLIEQQVDSASKEENT